MIASGEAMNTTAKYDSTWASLYETHEFSTGHSSDAYCSTTEIELGTTDQSVGTMRTHCPVANSSTT